MDKKETIKLIIDYWHRIAMHHALWYGEAIHQFGREKAFDILKSAYSRGLDIHMKRLSKVFDFNLDDNIPEPLMNMEKEKLDKIKEAVAANWLATDGVWFQAVEFTRGMNDAKRCNDSCWAHFSPFEAVSVKEFLKLDNNPGLKGLERALAYRLYAAVNIQKIDWENENSFVFRMMDCRVQSARKRKKLDDYPCKSAGLVEYTTFAETIDSRIHTECIACPPDKHPDDWYCSWRFTIKE